MLELLAFPRRVERKPWQMFFVGILYSSLAYLIVKIIFSKDVILSSSSGLLIVMFTSLFSVVFFFFALKRDERENIKESSEGKAIKDDWRILKMFLFLFLGFIAGFCFWQVVFPQEMAFNSQMQTYCVINKPLQYPECINNVGDTVQDIQPKVSGFSAIFTNNILVAIMILIFSLLFGAGVVFIIAWNASIISTVIVYSAKYSFMNIPLTMLRFLVHGIPEIAAYFLIVMAGGMSSFAMSSYFKGKISKENLLKVIRRGLYLILIGVVILFIAGLIEVYVSFIF